jgi:hypothetical protein
MEDQGEQGDDAVCFPLHIHLCYYVVLSAPIKWNFHGMKNGPFAAHLPFSIRNNNNMAVVL